MTDFERGYEQGKADAQAPTRTTEGVGMKIWVDPPEGWRYGFPKVWDSELHPNIYHWLDDRGYPPNVREGYGEFFTVRQWPVEGIE